MQTTLFYSFFLFFSLLDPTLTLSTLNNSSLENDYSNFSKEDFGDLDYDKFVEMRKSLVFRKRIVKQYVLEEKYPDLMEVYCGDEPCQTYMYELCNHGLSKRKIKTLPTVLLIGGIHGTETLGIRGLVSLVALLQKIYKSSKRVFRLLNNMRLLVIPVLNMNGFYSQTLHENVYFEKVDLKVDPNMDFNFNPQRFCFSSLSAQLVHRVFRDNVILGSLAFTKGPFELIYPQLSQIFGTNQTVSDEFLYKRVGARIIESFNRYNDSDLDSQDNFFSDLDHFFPALKFQVPSESNNNYGLGQMAPGTYIDWAFGGSAEKEMARNNCFAPGNFFSKETVIPSNWSNRAFAFEIALDKDLIPEYETKMGNEYALVNPVHPQAKFGIIPAISFATISFLEILNPSVSVHSISSEYQENLERHLVEQYIEFNFDLYGCIMLKETVLENTYPTEFKAKSADYEDFELGPKTRIRVKAKYTGNNVFDPDTKASFSFDFNCEYHILNHLKHSDGHVSHFLRKMMNKGYSPGVGQNRMFLSDVSNYKLMNVRFGALEEALVFEKEGDQSDLFYGKNLLVQVGALFPVALSYDSRTGVISHRIVDRAIPEKGVIHKRRSRRNFEADRSINTYCESGLINRVSSCENSSELLDSLRLMKSAAAEDLELFVYKDNITYLCSQFVTRGMADYFDKMKKSAASSKSKVKLSRYQMLKREKLTRRHMNQDSIALCSKYFEKDVTEYIKKTSRLKLTPNKTQRIVPTFFLSLAGRKTKISFKVKPTRANPIRSLEKNKSQLETKQLVGNIVFVDQDVTGLASAPRTAPFVSPRELSSEDPDDYFEFPPGGFSCGTVSPYFPISSKALNKTARKIYFKGQRPGDFFYINFQKRYQYDDSVLVTLYTTAPGLPDSVFLFNKGQSFELERAPEKSLEFPGEFDGSNISIFDGVFSQFEIDFIGVYVFLKPEAQDRVVFDCFLGHTDKYPNVKTQYIIYSNVVKEIKGIIKETFGSRIEHIHEMYVWYICPITVASLLFIGFLIWCGLCIKRRIGRRKGEVLFEDDLKSNETASTRMESTVCL